MNAIKEHKVIIIGAGPVGLSTALGLNALNIDTLGLGPSIPPAGQNPDTRTIALFQGAINFLKNLNLWENCKDQAIPLKAIRMIDDTRRLFRAPDTLFQASELELEAFGYNIPNAYLTEQLYTALIELNPDGYRETAAVTELEEQENCIRVITQEQDNFHTQLVIGADGRNSLSRDFSEVRTTSWKYPQIAIVCDFSHQYPHDNISNEFHTPSGPCTTVPLAGNNSSIVLVETPEEAQRIQKLDDTDFCRLLEKKLHYILGSVSRIGKRAQFPLGGLYAKSFANKRTALVGEAAHVFPPIGAQGLNLGFRDAASILETLRRFKAAKDYGSPRVLEEYNRTRRADIWSRTLAVDLLNRSLINDLLPAQIFRSATFGLLNRVGPLRRLFMRQGMQPDITLPPLMKEGADIR